MSVQVSQLRLLHLPPPKRKLPTNLTANHHPIHRWYNFIAGFSPEFVQSCIRDAGLAENDVLIDPFAGLSTALVEANAENIRSVGFEANPFFFDVSLAKLLPPIDTRPIDRIEKMGLSSVEPLTEELTQVWSENAVTFLSKLVPETDLRLLASVVLLERSFAPEDRSLYRLVMSRVLESCAGSQTDGIYKAPTSRKNSVPYKTALSKVCDEVREDISLVGLYSPRKSVLYPDSCESMSQVGNQTCSLCVTSPPYLNNFDFAEMTRMELYFWRYAGSWGEITERVRSRLIVNTTTAPTALKRAQSRFSQALSPRFRSEVAPVVDALRELQKVRAGKKDYHSLVYPYFAQMQSVIRELQRVLKPGSPLHMVVGDAALYGVHIRSDQLLVMLFEESGFELVNIDTLRTRGDRWILRKRQGADSPLGEFHIHVRRV